jgi:hypothetical protein
MVANGPCRFDPATPTGYAELILRSRIDRARALSAGGDVGASVVEWVIITALLVGMAAAVGTIILNKVKAKADTINLDSGTP